MKEEKEKETSSKSKTQRRSESWKAKDCKLLPKKTLRNTRETSSEKTGEFKDLNVCKVSRASQNNIEYSTQQLKQ